MRPALRQRGEGQGPRRASRGSAGGRRRASVTAMRRNGKRFVQAGSRGSSCAAAASQRSLARRGGRGFSVRLPVLRFALVILCLPRADGSEPSTGCQGYAADEFFSTDLSSGFFPASGYSPEPDFRSTVPDCDFTIDPDWKADKSGAEKQKEIRKQKKAKVICVAPGTYTGYEYALIGTQTGQTLIAKDPNDRPVFDNSGSTTPVVWQLKDDKKRFVGAQLINLEFVNTKISVDIPEVKIKGCKFSKGKADPAADGGVTDLSNTYITFYSKADDGDHEGKKWNIGDKKGKDLDKLPTTDDGEVSGCEFVRSIGYEGRAIAVERLHSDDGRKLRPKNTRIEYNVFGGSDPSSDGYFANAIYDGGENTVIQYNTIRRFVDTRAASSDESTVDAAKADQAHGIHSEGAIGSRYEGNVIAGWMPEAAGGAFKLDGSQRIRLFDNLMATSGILMHSDMNAFNPVPLRDIYIRSNKIVLDHTNVSPEHSYDLSAIGAGQRGKSYEAVQSGDIYRGIGMWIKNPATQPEHLSGYSPPGAGTAIRIESTEVWGPHGLIYFKAQPYAELSAIAETSNMYSGTGGVFESLACEIDQQSQGSDVPVEGSESLYRGNFEADCAVPNPLTECPDPPSAPPPPPGSPPLRYPPAQCIVDPADDAKVCMTLPPGLDINDGTDKAAQAWIRRIMKLDHATRNGLSLGGVYSDAYSKRTESQGACNGFNLLPTDTRTSGTCAQNGYSEIADADTCAEFVDASYNSPTTPEPRTLLSTPQGAPEYGTFSSPLAPKGCSLYLNAYIVWNLEGYSDGNEVGFNEGNDRYLCGC